MPVLDFPSAHISVSEMPSIVSARAEGIDDPQQLSARAQQALVRADFAYTLSVMCWPNNLEEITSFNKAAALDESGHYVDRLRQFGIKGAVDFDTFVESKHKQDPRQLLKRVLHKDELGHMVAGYILRWIVSRWRNLSTRDEASLANAVKMVETWCKVNKITRGGRRDNVERLWRKYQSVSHLWASFELTKYCLMENTKKFLPTEDDLKCFYGTAFWLFEQAAEIIPKHRRDGDAILSRDAAWVGLPAYAVEDGDKLYFAWNNDLDAHDLRSLNPPPPRREPV